MTMMMMMMMSFEASAQPTVDEGEAYCQSTTWEELVNKFRADMTDMKLMNRATLDQVKSILGSRQQTENETARVVNLITEGLAEVKNLLGCLQLPPRVFSHFDSSSLCE